MSTRSTTHFMEDGQTRAIVYRHPDGYPEGHGQDLQRFLDDVEAQTADHRYNDPSYLAAKLVVWLADMFASTYTRDEETGEYGYVKGEPLDFISVGVMMEDPGDIEFLYEVDCSAHLKNGRPEVRCYAVDHSAGWDAPITKGERVEIPEAVSA